MAAWQAKKGLQGYFRATQGAFVAKLSREEREQIAETRILRVLGTLTVANQRTLEQKISDAGPYNQRIDPHILTDVRNRLETEGAIATTTRLNAPWYYAGNTPSDIGGRIGQVLEIATYRALCQIPKADFSGRFRDLDSHDDSTMYKKEEPHNSTLAHCRLKGTFVSILSCAPLTLGH
jgi:hypothetical protein